MATSFKSNSNGWRQFGREMTKNFNKEIDKMNRNLKPIQLPVQSPNELGNGITINNTNNDNSIKIAGNVQGSQIGGSGNYLQVNETTDIEGILREIRELSKVMDKTERAELTEVIGELQNSGQVGENHKSFLEKHALVAMGISAVITYGLTYGLDILVPIIQGVFS